MTITPNTRSAARAMKFPPMFPQKSVMPAWITPCAPIRRWAAVACQPHRFSLGRKRAVLTGLILLETNTQPGMTPTSLAPEQAAACRDQLSRPLRLDRKGRLMQPLTAPPRTHTYDRKTAPVPP